MYNLKLLFYFGCVSMFACTITKNPSTPVQSTDGGIARGSLSEGSMNTALIAKMDSQIINGTYPNIHSVLISRNNKLLFEKYYTGKDQSWGSDLGMVTHHRDSLHDIRSVTKSIVGACFGIAMAQGKITSVDQKVLDFFPEYKHLDTGMKSLLTLKHLLTMSTGLVWNENVPYSDSTNSEMRMIRSPNQIEFVLSQPMDMAPGTMWKYNGGATQLLASIIQKTTGKKIDDFAAQYLFAPLGINRYYWFKYPGTDLPAAASGLRLTSTDLLKFGMLYANEGKFNGKEIISAEWITESTKRQIKIQGPPGSSRSGYGYHFYLVTIPLGNKIADFVMAVGNGGQRILIDKPNELVVVITAGNYNMWDIKNDSGALLFDLIYPAIK